MKVIFGLACLMFFAHCHRGGTGHQSCTEADKDEAITPWLGMRDDAIIDQIAQSPDIDMSDIVASKILHGDSAHAAVVLLLRDFIDKEAAYDLAAQAVLQSPNVYEVVSELLEARVSSDGKALAGLLRGSSGHTDVQALQELARGRPIVGVDTVTHQQLGNIEVDVDRLHELVRQSHPERNVSLENETWWRLLHQDHHDAVILDHLVDGPLNDSRQDDARLTQPAGGHSIDQRGHAAFERPLGWHSDNLRAEMAAQQLLNGHSNFPDKRAIVAPLQGGQLHHRR